MSKLLKLPVKDLIYNLLYEWLKTVDIFVSLSTHKSTVFQLPSEIMNEVDEEFTRTGLTYRTGVGVAVDTIWALAFGKFT